MFVFLSTATGTGIVTTEFHSQECRRVSPGFQSVGQHIFLSTRAISREKLTAAALLGLIAAAEVSMMFIFARSGAASVYGRFFRHLAT